MIKFFRQIRQQLLMENKTGKYLKYAIGEIILVVVGILIALQINNWNENRKLRNQEDKLLLDLRSDLNASLNELTDGKKYNEATLRNYQLIHDAIVEDRSFHDSLEVAFGVISNWHSPYFSYTAYESLKTKGIDIIQNDTLKGKIVKMYERTYEYLVEDYDKSEWNFNLSINGQIVNRHIRYRTDSLKKRFAYPLDFEALKSDPEFMNMLSAMMLKRNSGIMNYQLAIEDLKMLIDDIDNELERE
ncbi:MAG: hypothetical protein HKN52_08500 [Eudoraea sp.]|nr:hypothetical protein [Eudoraea sp.]